MNNLKRVLSLGLSGVMLAGLLSVGASAADFTDAGDIEHTDAVNTLVALKIIDGKPDGSFAPEENVSRSQMAKMIAIAMNGGSDANTGTKSTPSFTDIKGHWAESFIEYCHDLGIISGRGDGTFDPDATVTGYEATKMVLTALGYDAEAYKLNGAQWATNTDQQARQADPALFEELTGVPMAAPATRDTAAQLIWNGLQNTTRRVTPSTNKNNGEVTWQYRIGNYMIYERYGADVLTGTYVGNYDTTDATNEGEIYVSGTQKSLDINGNVVTTTVTGSFPSDLDISNIGEEVRVIYKDSRGKGGVTGSPDKTDTIYGVFNTGSTQVIEATLNDIATGSSAPKESNKVKISGTVYTVAPATNDATVAVVRNYGATGPVTVDGNGTPQTNLNNSDPLFQSRKAAFEALKVAQSGDWVKFVCDNDGRITTAYVVNSTISYVTAITSSKITLSNEGTFDIDKNDVEEGLKKNDVVVFTKFYDSDKDDAFYTVKKAEAVQGEMTGYKFDDGAYVNIVLDGTTYKTNRKALVSANINSNASETGFDRDDIGEDFTAYMMNGYAALVMQDSESANKVALIKALNTGKLGAKLDEPKLDLLLADGTEVVAVVDKDSSIYTTDYTDGNKVSNNGQTAINASNVLEPGQIVRYSVTSSGTYKIVEVIAGTSRNDYSYTKATVSSGDQVYDKDTKSISGDNFNTSTVADGDCVLFVKQTNNGVVDYKVYSIRNLNDVDANSAVFNYMVRDGKAIAAYVELNGRPSGASGSMVYGIVASYIGTRQEDGDTYYKYTVENQDNKGDDAYVVAVDEFSTVIDTGDVIGFEPSKDGIYNDGDITVYTGTALNNTDGLATWVREYDKGAQTLTYWTAMTKNGENDYRGSSANTVALDDNCVIAYVNQDDGEGGDDIDISEFDSSTGYRNVLLVQDSTSTKVVAVIVESSHEDHVVNMAAKSIAAGTITAAADLKALADGAYAPKTDATLTSVLNGLDGFSGDAADTRIIKYDTGAADGKTYNLEVYDAAGTKVYYGDSVQVGTNDGRQTVVFYFLVKNGANTNKGTEAGAFNKVDVDAGTYIVKILQGASVVFTTSFTV